MTDQITRAADVLFPLEGGGTRNIKFLCGGDHNIAAQGLAEQYVRAEVQIVSRRARLVPDVDGHLTPET